MSALSDCEPVKVGMLFSSKGLYAAIEQEFRKVGRGIRAGKGGSRQRQYFCDQRVVGESGVEKGCTARIRATRQVTNEFKVTYVDTEHVNCAGSTTTATIRGMEPVLNAAIRNNPKISHEALMKTVENSTGATMSSRSIARAKSKLMQADHKEGSDTFKQLRPYLKELQAHSPGTVTSVEADSDGHFLRCFVMTGKAAHVAATSMPKVSTMDQAIIKGPFKGMMIMLSVKDSNNKVLHVAAAIVPKKDPEGYVYLLSQCMRNEEFASFFDSEDMTCYTAGHRASPDALARVTPRTQRRVCVKHLLSLAPAIGSACTAAIYLAARAPTRAQFDKDMDIVKRQRIDAYDHLLKTNVALWTHHASAQHTVVLDQVTTNLGEYAVHVDDGDARLQSPLQLLEAIVDRTAGELAERATTGMASSENFTPFAVKTFDTEMMYSATLTALPYGDSTYKVTDGDIRPSSNTVDLEFRSPQEGGPWMCCTCGFTRRYKIPCRHVLAVVKRLRKMDVARTLIDEGYSVSKYREALSTRAFRIRPPVVATLTKDESLFPPKKVEARSRKRKQSSGGGDGRSPSRSNTPSSSTPAGAGAGAGSTAAGSGGEARQNGGGALALLREPPQET